MVGKGIGGPCGVILGPSSDTPQASTKQGPGLERGGAFDPGLLVASWEISTVGEL